MHLFRYFSHPSGSSACFHITALQFAALHSPQPMQQWIPAVEFFFFFIDVTPDSHRKEHSRYSKRRDK